MSAAATRGKVLVLGTDTRALLAVVRSLGRGGLEVHLAAESLDPLSRQSRYLRAAEKIPAYDVASPEWKISLINLMKQHRYDLILPLNDAWVTALHRHRGELGQYGKLAVPDPLAFAVFFNKIKTTDLARHLGIPVPQEAVITSIEDMDVTDPDLQFPIILKPATSHNDGNPGHRNVVLQARNHAELVSLLQPLLETGPVAVQKFFRGTGVGVELLLRNGEPLLAFQHARVHEPLQGGGSSYRQSVDIAPDLYAAAGKLLRALRYTGVAMVEFRVSHPTSAWILLEVNARFWGSLPVATASGADFPLALYQLLVEGRTDFQKHYRTNVYSRSLSQDLRWYLEALRSRDATTGKKVLDLAGEGLGTLLRVGTLREHVDSWAVDDPAPFGVELKQLRGAFTRKQRKIKANATLQSQATRRRLQSLLSQSLPGITSVLFVCKGNICRSPFAEQLAHERWPATVSVSSAGYYPRAGRPAPDLARRAAADWHVDLTAHRSRIVTADMMKTAEIIFVFDEENYSQLVQQFAFAKERVHYLGAIGTSPSVIIADPYGTDPETFQAVYGQIADAIAAAGLPLGSPSEHVAAKPPPTVSRDQVRLGGN